MVTTAKLARFRVIGFGLLGVLALGCRERSIAPGQVVKRAGSPDVLGASDDNAALNAAMEQAQSSLPAFTRELQQPRANALYHIKARFDEPPHVEHIWLTDLEYADGSFTGTIGNDPIYLRRIVVGDRVDVASSRVSDWLILENGKFRGGFTIRVLFNQASPAEKRDLAAQFGAVPE